MEFYKYQALGNDYLVVDASLVEHHDRNALVRICDRNRGIGSDGILLDLGRGADGFLVRIINPDGSEAEKSGNGLRIYARYLLDQGRVSMEVPFSVSTPGGMVRCVVHEQGGQVTVDMGPGEVLGTGDIDIDGRGYAYTAVSMGNPHCVVFHDEPSAELARELGPRIEVDPRFPDRTNVQFVRIIDRSNIQLEIWERGAGYTLASGSSASAAVTAAHHHGRVDAQVTAHMPGGPLAVSVLDNRHIRIKGAVAKVATVRPHEEMYSG